MRKVVGLCGALRAGRSAPRRSAARLAAMGLAAAAVAMPLAGCEPAGLSREEQVRMLMARSRRCEDELLAAQQKLAALEAAGAQPQPLAPPEDPFRPAAVRFGKYSGILDGGRPRAEQRLRVIIEPLDSTGDVVKRAGSLELEARAPAAAPPAAHAADHPAAGAAAPGAAQPQVYRWTFSADEMRQAWLSGLGTYGYILKLPWPGGRAPTGDRLTLRAKFTTLAGEVLEAETEVPLDSQNQGAPAALRQ
ncbi:MAG: hypothetical protein FJ288_04485 [Planctomycetes bacterium]|nr:hypothetical protein [Planctomycetota bacterium]